MREGYLPHEIPSEDFCPELGTISDPCEEERFERPAYTNHLSIDDCDL